MTLTNTGTRSPIVSSLVFRYYFSDEAMLDPPGPTVFLDLAAWKSNVRPPYFLSLPCATHMLKLVPARAGADSAMEIACASDVTLAPSEQVVLQLRLSGGGEIPENDYSFRQGDASQETTNDHIVVLQDGAVVWGVEP